MNNFIRYIIAATVMLAVPCCHEQQGWAQIEITQNRMAYYSGFSSVKILDDGMLAASIESKPKLERVETSIVVVGADQFKFGQLKARRLPGYERIAVEQISKTQYRLKDATEGQFFIEYSAFDPERGIASDEATIKIEGIDPAPIIPDLQGLPADSRKAMVGLVQGMADDMDRAADAVTSGKAKTMLELQSITTPLDVSTRNVFKKSMATLLEPRLGNSTLPADAPKVLKDVATGFRSVK